MFKVFFCKGKALHQGLPCTEKREQATKAVPSLENYEKGREPRPGAEPNTPECPGVQ